MTNAILSQRRIFKSVITSRKVIQELLTLMMIGELIDPGSAVWIVSPWITDVPLLDNRGGSFDAMNPEWGRKEVRLVDIAVQLMVGGTEVKIVTRPDNHNKVFLRRLEDAASAAGVRQALSISERDSLHTKGVLTSRGLMLGSMNLTYNGLDLNDEVITYDTSTEAVGNARLAFATYLETPL